MTICQYPWGCNKIAKPGRLMCSEHILMTLDDAKKHNIVKMSDYRQTPRAVYANNPLFTVRLHLEGKPHAECHDLTALDAAKHSSTLQTVLVKGFSKDHPNVTTTTSVDITTVRGRTTHYILAEADVMATVLAKIEVEIQYD